MIDPDTALRVLNTLKPSPKTWLAISIFYLSTLFGGRLGVAIPFEISPIIHIAGLIALVFVFIEICIVVFYFFKKRTKHRNLKQYLRSLSPAQRKIFKAYIFKDRRSVKFKLDDGEVRHLEDLGFIYRATEITSSVSLAFSYVIQPWVWTFLNKNKNLLKTDDTIVAFVGGDDFSGREVK
ncbi:MAG: superinfection exclusion B family protein [Deltaproteobacteria bacterium]|nr:superinfection exclusion B family protein [Deltaproteobacteria bacterium]